MTLTSLNAGASVFDRARRLLCASTLKARIQADATVMVWPLDGLVSNDGVSFDLLMSMPVTDMHYSKQGRSVGRCVIDTPSGKRVVYLKRYRKAASPLQAVLSAAAPSRARFPALAEGCGHLRVSQWGIPVPEVVAAAERIGPWFRRQSLIAIGELEGMLPLHLALPEAARLKPGPAFRAWKRSLAREVARLVRAIHGRKHFHKDLYLSHFYCRRQDLLAPIVEPGRIYLIDMHRLARHFWSSMKWRVQDLAQLLFSSEIAEISRRDRICFYGYYLGAERSWRMVLKIAVRFQAWHFRNHNARSGGGTPRRAA